MNETTAVPAPIQAEQTSEPEATNNVPEPSSGSSAKGPLLISLVALGVSIGLAATAYFTWHQVQQLLGEQAAVDTRIDARLQPLSLSIDNVATRIDDNRSQLDKRLEPMERRLDNLGEEQQSTAQRLNVLAALMGRSEQGWGLSEVEYLLRIASQRLQLQRDTGTAEAALKSADARLRDLADPHFLTVRQQIARDIDALKRVPVVDVDGISLALSTWLERVDDLPIAGTRYQPPVQTGAPAFDATATATDWKEIPALIWSSLSELFLVREHDKPVAPMLPPERQYFLRENLRLQLAAARLALLRNDTLQYQSGLKTSRDWLLAYFSADDASVMELSDKLETLAGIDIKPGLPDISASLRLLHQQMKLTEKQDVLPVVPEQAPAQAADQSAIADDDVEAAQTESPSDGDEAQ